MTAQKLTGSSPTDPYKAFKQALEHKASSEKPYRRDQEAMPIPEDKQQQQQQQQQQQKQQPTQEQASGVVVTPASSARPQPWAGINNVELDSREDGQPRNQRPHEKEQEQEQEQQRHQQPAMVIVADDAAPAGGDAGGAAATSGRGAASGAEIPMSPPSSPTHVATVATASQDERAGGSSTVVPGPQPGATETSAGAEVGPAPAPHPPGSGGTTTKPPGGAAGAGGDAPAVAPPVVPVRLGRGRKLCPSCKALTKSAVKQCRECKHVFNPASSRLRAQQQHLQPKENEAPALPRRRHRPSQRLLESLVVSADDSSAGGAGAGAASAATVVAGSASPSSSARRPLAASNSAGGGNQSPVTSSGAASTKKTGAGGAGGAGSGSGEQQPQQQQQPAKRSHKRKVPLPPGVAPPKRRKGAAAAARLAATKTASAAAAAAATVAATAAPPVPSPLPAMTHSPGILPVLSLPEQQRVAEDLLASPAPARHVLVPESPELAPMASPAGPLLFISSSSSCSSSSASSSLEDGQDWAPRGGAGFAFGGSGSGSGSGGAGAGVATFMQQQRRQRHHPHHSLAAVSAASALAGLLLEGDEEEEQERRRQEQLAIAMRRQEGGSGGGGGAAQFHLPGDAQERDPFAGVEMTWWDGGEMSGTNPAACVPTSFPMVGRDGTMEQRSAFSLAQSTELLGDTDDALLWNPLRASSSNETHQYGSGAPGAASRSLTLWPGSSNSDTSLLMSAAAPPAESRSPSPQNSVFPNFARGAAIASAAGATGSAGGSKVGASNTSASGGSPEFLLAESSCSSLPGPLVFGDSGASGWPPAAAVTADSADGEEEGGFWSPP